MSVTYLFARNATQYAVPTAGQLSSGEAVLNTSDNVIFIKMGTSVRSFTALPISSEKTASFTADYGYIYDLHNTADLIVTLPTWVQGRSFEVTLDGDAKNHALTFTYRTGEDINGTSADVSASTKNSGDIYVVRAVGTSSDKHWSITKQAAI